APHKLRQDIDKGQLVVAGSGIEMPKGQVSENVRTHFVDDDDAIAITDRAKALRSGITTLRAVEADEDLDPLADIAQILGDVRLTRTQEVLHKLDALNPAAYRSWTFQDLTDVLEAVDATPHKSNGVMVIDRLKIHRALA